MPASADEIVFERIAPALRSGQKVVFWTGYFRTFRIAHRFGRLLAEKGVSLWETHTQPFGTRVKGPGVVEMDQTMGPVFYARYPGWTRQRTPSASWRRSTRSPLSTALC